MPIYLFIYFIFFLFVTRCNLRRVRCLQQLAQPLTRCCDYHAPRYVSQWRQFGDSNGIHDERTTTQLRAPITVGADHYLQHCGRPEVRSCEPSELYGHCWFVPSPCCAVSPSRAWKPLPAHQRSHAELHAWKYCWCHRCCCCGESSSLSPFVYIHI
jgi:hypothetical protein